MKILIVDDSRLARRELQELLSTHSQYEVVGEAVDVASALTALNRLKPDLLLLDIHLPDGSGFDVLERISKPDPELQTHMQHHANPTATKNPDAHVFIREGERCHFVKYKEIRHICVEGNYVRVFFRDTNALLLRSLSYVEQRMDPELFFRANRQHIINLNFIDRVEPWIGDGLQIILRDATEVIASRRQERELIERLDF